MISGQSLNESNSQCTFVLQKCRVSDSEVHQALLAGDPQDQLVIAYNLVIDNKRIADESKCMY